jgi:serine/threonine protein kinase
LIARKELKPGKEDFSERAVLEMLNQIKHPNIVEFLGSYSQHGLQNLLFPYVPMDLRQLLEKPPLDPDIIYANIYGLADALRNIHEFTFKDKDLKIEMIGYHHDLRPANILVNGGVFIIADFGLSKLKLDIETSKSRLRGGHDDYLGPESFNEADWANGSVGRALDVWAFGCVLADIATYLKERSVVEFREKRKSDYGHGNIFTTDHAFHLDGQLKPAVDIWLQELLFDPHDKQICQLVTLIRNLLNPNSRRRMKMLSVIPTLALLAKQSKVESVLSAFGRVSYDKEHRNTHHYILVLLEQKRFEAWDSSFDLLHHDQRLDTINSIILYLDNLKNALSAFEKDQKSLALRGTPSPPPEPFDQMCGAIDSLCIILPTHIQEGIEKLWSKAVIEIKDVETLGAIRAAPKPQRYRSVGIKAAMSYMSRIISDSIRSGVCSHYLDSGCIDVEEFQSTASLNPDVQLMNDKSKTMGYFATPEGKIRVLIEWKEYNHLWQAEPGDKLFEIMDALANLLNTRETPRQGVVKHRLLDCLGYFHETFNHRFGFIYAIPEHPSVDSLSKIQVYSLNNVIRMTSADMPNAIRPDLGDIFFMAKELVATLSDLHQVGWIHKNISSYQILLFSSSQEEAYKCVATSVLTGFNDSRPEASGITLGPNDDFPHYQHPLYCEGGVGFRKSFDFFSMGIVLLELGLWVPISILWSAHSECPETFSAEDFRQKLLRTYVPMLGEKMGALYRDAVSFCLDAEYAVEMEIERAGKQNTAQELFRVKVVEPLMKCVA